MPGLKEGKAKLLAEHDIRLIGDLVVLEEEDMEDIAARTKGLTGKALMDFFNEAMKHMVEEEAPDGVYWLDEENPFAARYGSDKDKWGVEAWVTQQIPSLG